MARREIPVSPYRERFYAFETWFEATDGHRPLANSTMTEDDRHSRRVAGATIPEQKARGLFGLGTAQPIAEKRTPERGGLFGRIRSHKIRGS